MYLFKKLCSFFILLFAVATNAQPPIYTFQKDDAALKEKLYNQALADKDKLVNALGKENKNDYKQWYEGRFEVSGELLKSKTTVTEATAYNYLQSILQKIVSVNPELQGLNIRLVFTRDNWPNAYSIGDGTIALNAALFIRYDNEAQLVFTICHELSHYYLQHNEKKLKQLIDLRNDEELKKQVKALAKQKYKVGEKLEEMGKRFAFGYFRNSREAEREADAYALKFMKNTGYDCREALTALKILDKLNDSTELNSVDIKKVFNFSDYPFKDKWIKSESSIFSAMSNTENTSLTKAEKDSLKTHPDIPERMKLLTGVVNETNAGKIYLVSEETFHALQKQFIAEMVEQVWENKNIGEYLFLAIQLLEMEEYKDYGAYGILRSLNSIYRHQKDHSLGMVTDKESRYYPNDYNMLLRMIDRLKLNEIADLGFAFAKKYNQLSSYKEFAEEMRAAQKNKSEN